jgi:hypothetical protein
MTVSVCSETKILVVGPPYYPKDIYPQINLPEKVGDICPENIYQDVPNIPRANASAGKGLLGTCPLGIHISSG